MSNIAKYETTASFKALLIFKTITSPLLNQHFITFELERTQFVYTETQKYTNNSMESLGLIKYRNLTTCPT